MKKLFYIIPLFLLVIIGCKSSKYADLGDGIFADIQTTKGDIIIQLEYKKTPVTVANFVSLAEGKTLSLMMSTRTKNSTMESFSIGSLRIL